MPGGKGMGPEGMGPMTGRAAGYCTNGAVPGYANPGRARGFLRRGDELGMLRTKARSFETALSEVTKRINELETEDK